MSLEIWNNIRYVSIDNIFCYVDDVQSCEKAVATWVKRYPHSHYLYSPHQKVLDLLLYLVKLSRKYILQAEECKIPEDFIAAGFYVERK